LEAKEKINTIIEEIDARMKKGTLKLDSGSEIAGNVLEFMNENNIFAGTSAEEEAKEQGYEDMEEFMIDNYGVWEWTNSISEISEKNLAKILLILEKSLATYR
jgi:hypothetical protein